MRRDICIGLLVSALFDCGVVLTSTRPALAPLLRAEVHEIEVFMLPPPPPEELPPEDPDATSKKPIEVAVPMIQDVVQIAPPEGFVQPLQPPVPEPATQPIAYTIPTNPGSGKLPGQTFEPADLDQGPLATTRTVPAYPFPMRQAGIEGTVVVDFIVDPRGGVQRAYAVSSTNPAFESAAVQGVSKWRFRAGRKNGRPVSTHMQIPIVFSLNHAD